MMGYLRICVLLFWVFRAVLVAASLCKLLFFLFSRSLFLLNFFMYIVIFLVEWEVVFTCVDLLRWSCPRLCMISERQDVDEFCCCSLNEPIQRDGRGRVGFSTVPKATLFQHSHWFYAVFQWNISALPHREFLCLFYYLLAKYVY